MSSRSERRKNDPDFAAKLRAQERAAYERKKLRRQQDAEYAEHQRAIWRKANSKQPTFAERRAAMSEAEVEAAREKERERDRQRREENRKRRVEDKEWAEMDRKRRREHARNWEEKQKAKGPEYLEDKRQRSAQYRELNGDKYNQTRRETSVWNKVSVSANQKNLQLTVSRDTVETMGRLPCHYCGTAPQTIHGIDRMDNGLGYVPDNIVSCCTTCNFAKGTMTFNDFARHMRRPDLLRDGGDLKTCRECLEKKDASHFKVLNNSCIECIEMGKDK